MEKIRQHMELLCSNMPSNRKTQQKKEDLIHRLEKKALQYIQEGKQEEDAINKAIVEFGSNEEFYSKFFHVDNPIRHRKMEVARSNFGFSMWGSVLLIGFLVFLNFYYTPTTIWFIYPTFAILWWPLSIYYYMRKLGGTVK